MTDGSTCNVLIIDSDAMVANLMAAILSDAGYTPILLRPTGDAAGLMCHTPPQLLLLDVHPLHTHHAWQLLACLGRLGVSDVPIILCSTDGNLLQNGARHSTAGSMHFLRKPFEIDELLATVTAALGRPAAP